MILRLNGKIIKGVGGSYQIRLCADGAQRLRECGIDCVAQNDSDSASPKETLYCRARGVFRHEKLTLLAGDEVALRIDTELLLASQNDSAQTRGKGKDEVSGGVLIDEVFERRNELIRPPMSNLDIMFVVFSAAKPEPALTTVDKLVTIAEYKHIEPVIVITKADLDLAAAERYADIYKKCGFEVFIIGKDSPVDEIMGYINAHSDKTSAFAGASGVGKSTLMNRLFPSLGLVTGEVSPKTAHGRHTTRHIELYPLSYQIEGATGYLADTPGFGMLDFVQFDFYTKDDLLYVFREFEPYIGKCRYTKCTHTKEEGCAILEAVENCEIPKERHQSYLEFYEVLKSRKNYKS
ncbi:MAG: ribosome small subunit-dependent GTPase A [Clostridiales bacterium]|nr:ribosome small subunit-dependent GTPase A [Clostridiales bacterium]